MHSHRSCRLPQGGERVGAGSGLRRCSWRRIRPPLDSRPPACIDGTCLLCRLLVARPPAAELCSSLLKSAHALLAGSRGGCQAKRYTSPRRAGVSASVHRESSSETKEMGRWLTGIDIFPLARLHYGPF
ncbi:unnamed protein product [Urochloa humidicola]